MSKQPKHIVVENIHAMPKKKIVHTFNSFHGSLRFLIILSQCFGYFPVQGVYRKSEKYLRFSWFSLVGIYSLMVLSGALLSAFLNSLFMIMTGNIQIFELNNILFYVRGALTCFLFMRLGMVWPCMIKEFHLVEMALKEYPFKTGLSKKLKFFTIGFYIIAAAEHVLIQVGNFLVILRCETNYSIASKRYFVEVSYPRFFHFIPYSLPLGIMMQILNTNITFGWNFLDLFVVLSSIAFSTKVTQIKDKITGMVDKKITVENAWKVIREDYNKLYNSFKLFNDNLDYIILLSFATNLYFILTQLFGTLHMAQSTILQVYYVLSFTLLIMRIVFVCVYGGVIYEESINILKILTGVPSSMFNKEIERLIVELNIYPMVLTGKNFFSITKSLILQLAGAVVTYELILIKFGGEDNRNRSRTNSSC